MKLKTFFNRLGYDIEVRDLMLSHIENWEAWYKGNVASFHNYVVYNGAKKISMKRKTLNMAKKVCEDYASYLMNEKVRIKFGNDKNDEIIKQILDDNSFYVLANTGVERTNALGTGAFVLSLNDLILDENTGIVDTQEARLKIEFVTADKIIPLSYENGKITECAFAVRKTINNKNVLVVSIHELDKNYKIKNYLLQIGKGGNLTDITSKLDESLKEFDTLSNRPWFFIIKPNIVNNIYSNSPYGISIFANSLDVLQGLDITYDSFVNEFILGKKRIFLREDLIKYDELGTAKAVFDTNDVVYHQLPTGEMGESDKAITESNMTLRINEHREGIQVNLNLLSSKVGMGDSNYKFDGNKVSTATEIISENSDLYRSIKKHEIILDDALIDMFKTMLYICKNFLQLGVTEDDEITIDFDDSIIEDKGEIKRQALLELNANLIDKVEYFILTRGYSEDQAKEFVKKMEERSPTEEEPLEEE